MCFSTKYVYVLLENKMAIEINLDGQNTTKTEDFKGDHIPATQGNLVNTINSYNDELKKKYYDKPQIREDETILQENIKKLVTQLVKNHSFHDNATSADDTVERPDSDNDILESMGEVFGGDEGKSYDLSGLIQKVNILANLVSGSTDSDAHKWTSSLTGNKVGEENTTLNVPVVGYTRTGDNNYGVDINQSSSTISITGLHKVDNNDVSDKTLISEKQVSQMLLKALSVYDSRLAILFGYLLYTEGEIPDSYKYVLKHSTQDDIQYAPLYMTYNEHDDCYDVHDLNGELTLTEDINFRLNNSNPVEYKNWRIVLTSDFKAINVYYNFTEGSNPVYTIPVIQKELAVDIGIIKDLTNENFTYEYRLFNNTAVIDNNDISFDFDGKSAVRIPIGSEITIILNNGWSGTIYRKDNNDVVSVSNGRLETIKITENVGIYTKKLRYILEPKNGSDARYVEQRYTDNNMVFAIQFNTKPSLEGYNLGNNTVLGGQVDSFVSIRLSDVHLNPSYFGITEGEIKDELVWTLKNVTLKLHYRNAQFEEDLSSVQYNCKDPIEPIDVRGWIFKGWWTKDENDEYVEEITHCPVTDEQEIDLYAKQDLEQYKDVFILNGGTFEGTTPNETHEYNPSSSPLPTDIIKNGYTFAGWYISPNFKEDEITENYLNEPAYYYAKWVENTYTISFTLKSSVDSENNPFVEDAVPYFKYLSVSMKSSNLPVTLGQPVMKGYKFLHWKLNGDIKDTIDLSDFGNDNTSLTLVASWEPCKVNVIEEFYYKQDDNNGVSYDLLETREYKSYVGQTYTKSVFSCAEPFEEISDPYNMQSNPFTVKCENNVFKRYFKRKTYTVTYYEPLSSGNQPSTYTLTYSDNALELLSIDDSNFDCWLAENTGATFDCIPAYNYQNLAFVARYNQAAPVENTDFSITFDNETFTINKIGNNPNYKSLKVLFNEQSYPINDTKSFSFNEVYSGVTQTNYCFVYFDEIQWTELGGNESYVVVNTSPLIKIPLKFSNSAPSSATNYEIVDNSKVYRRGTEDLEIKFANSNTYSNFEFVELPMTESICLRKKETYCRYTSESVSLNRTDKSNPSTESLIMDNIEVFNVTFNEPGKLHVSRSISSGNHGITQYRIGENTKWEDLIFEDSYKDILVYKPENVYFRYAEDDVYFASEPISVPVPMKNHMVTINFNEYPTIENGLNFSPFSVNATDEKYKIENNEFKISVISGGQLSDTDDYIKNVDDWYIIGYTKNTGCRTFNFLKETVNGEEKAFNEANIISEDRTIEMKFVPYNFGNITFMDSFFLNNERIPLKSSYVEDNCTKAGHEYGKPITVNIPKIFTDSSDDFIIDDDVLIRILNDLDNMPGYGISFDSKVVAAENGVAYDMTNNYNVIDGQDSMELNYTSNDAFPIRNITNGIFTYKFASVFRSYEMENQPGILIQFSGDSTDNNSDAIIMKIYRYTNGSVESGDYDNLYKYKITETGGSNATLDLYAKDDIRIRDSSDYLDLTSSNIITSLRDKHEINVKFHSCICDGVFKPAFEQNSVFVRTLTETNWTNVFTTTENNIITSNGTWNVSDSTELIGNATETDFNRVFDSTNQNMLNVRNSWDINSQQDLI